MRKRCLGLIALFVMTMCATASPGGLTTKTEAQEPPRVQTPVGTKPLPVVVKPDALPAGAAAEYPGFEGAPFFVTLPPGPAR